MITIILHVRPEDLILAARMARRLQEPDYVWDQDGVALFDYEGTLIAAKKTKTGFSIWSQ